MFAVKPSAENRLLIDSLPPCTDTEDPSCLLGKAMILAAGTLLGETGCADLQKIAHVHRNRESVFVAVNEPLDQIAAEMLHRAYTAIAKGITPYGVQFLHVHSVKWKQVASRIV